MINKSDDERDQYDRDYYDWYSEPFPPAAYPWRELMTMGVTALMVLAGCWWLFCLAWSALQ